MTDFDRRACMMLASRLTWWWRLLHPKLTKKTKETMRELAEGE